MMLFVVFVCVCVCWSKGSMVVKTPLSQFLPVETKEPRTIWKRALDDHSIMPNRLPTPRQSQGPVGKEGIYSAALVSSAAAGAGASVAGSFAASGAASAAAGSASDEVQRVCEC